MEERTVSKTGKQEFRTLHKVERIAWWVIVPTWLLDAPLTMANIWKPGSVANLFDRLGPGFMAALIVLYVFFYTSVLVVIVCALKRLVHRLILRSKIREQT